MSSRSEILKRVRLQRPQSSELPSLNEDWVRYGDPVSQFAMVLANVGGHCAVVTGRREADEIVRSLDAYTSAKMTVSLVPGVGASTIDLNAITDPHELDQVDLAVLPGEWAVAENAAVWVTDIVRGAPARQSGPISLRALYFLSQHVALVVPKSAVVHNMHEAYERIDIEAAPFGAFISGPSKTADIEQALVIGAHGARSLTVLLVDEAPQS